MFNVSLSNSLGLAPPCADPPEWTTCGEFLVHIPAGPRPDTKPTSSPHEAHAKPTPWQTACAQQAHTKHRSSRRVQTVQGRQRVHSKPTPNKPTTSPHQRQEAPTTSPQRLRSRLALEFGLKEQISRPETIPTGVEFGVRDPLDRAPEPPNFPTDVRRSGFGSLTRATGSKIAESMFSRAVFSGFGRTSLRK